MSMVQSILNRPPSRAKRSTFPSSVVVAPIATFSLPLASFPVVVAIFPHAAVPAIPPAVMHEFNHPFVNQAVKN
jgi:hypothetical protein